jgi:primosomal protein N'
MIYYLVAPNKVFRAGGSVLTYHFAEKLPVGMIVEIEVGKQKALGVIIEQVAVPEFKTKPILRAIFDTPLPPHLLKAADFLGDYYATNTAVVWQTILPAGLK